MPAERTSAPHRQQCLRCNFVFVPCARTFVSPPPEGAQHNSLSQPRLLIPALAIQPSHRRARSPGRRPPHSPRSVRNCVQPVSLKMPKNYQATIALLGALVTLTTALPKPASTAAGVDGVAPSGDPDAPASIDLPFLQFKNGGIRVNFAGYHAEAGLGGLLGGSDAKGGLFASAGTPWGPSASAGLGGAIDGQEGRARGGLHARAGLGNGRPEAAAGLGGTLDGSARSNGRASGGLFAGATAGGPVQAAAGLGGSVDGSGAPNSRTGAAFAGASNGEKSMVVAKEVSHIQPIKPAEKGSTTLEFKVPGLDSKKEMSSSIVTREVGSPSPKNNATGANAIPTGTDAQDRTDLGYPARRYFRKRLREANAFRKNLYKVATVNSVAPVLPAVSGSANVEGGIVERQSFDNPWSGDVPAYIPYGAAIRPKTTLFDDIFNIPISALTAVNQLLNNKSG